MVFERIKYIWDELREVIAGTAISWGLYILWPDVVKVAVAIYENLKFLFLGSSPLGIASIIIGVWLLWKKYSPKGVSYGV